MLEGMKHMPLADHKYLYLVAGNIGAVIMPWMIFFQQSALVEKGVGVRISFHLAQGNGDWCGDHANHHGSGVGGHGGNHWRA